MATITNPTTVTANLGTIITDHLITNGNSNLTELIQHRTFVPELDRYATLGPVAFIPHNPEQLLEIRYMLNLVYKHDGTESDKNTADNDLHAGIMDWVELLGDYSEDKHTLLSGTVIEQIAQVAVAHSPPPPKYHPDLYWIFIPIQVRAALWQP